MAWEDKALRVANGVHPLTTPHDYRERWRNHCALCSHIRPCRGHAAHRSDMDYPRAWLVPLSASISGGAFHLNSPKPSKHCDVWPQRGSRETAWWVSYYDGRGPPPVYRAQLKRTSEMEGSSPPSRDSPERYKYGRVAKAWISLSFPRRSPKREMTGSTHTDSDHTAILSRSNARTRTHTRGADVRVSESAIETQMLRVAHWLSSDPVRMPGLDPVSDD